MAARDAHPEQGPGAGGAYRARSRDAQSQSTRTSPHAAPAKTTVTAARRATTHARGAGAGAEEAAGLHLDAVAELDATQTLRALAGGAAVHSAAAAAVGEATRTAEAEGAEAAEDHASHVRPTRGGEASNLVSTPTPYNFHEHAVVRHKALTAVA